MIVTCLSPLFQSVFHIGKALPEPSPAREASIMALERTVRRRIAELAPAESQGTLALEAFTEGILPRLRPSLECVYDWGYLTWHEYAIRKAPAMPEQSQIDRIRRAVLNVEFNRTADRYLQAFTPQQDPAVTSHYAMKTAAVLTMGEILPQAWRWALTDAEDDERWRRCWPDLLMEQCK